GCPRSTGTPRGTPPPWAGSGSGRSRTPPPAPRPRAPPRTLAAVAAPPAAPAEQSLHGLLHAVDVGAALPPVPPRCSRASGEPAPPVGGPVGAGARRPLPAAGRGEPRHRPQRVPVPQGRPSGQVDARLRTGVVVLLQPVQQGR